MGLLRHLKRVGRAMPWVLAVSLEGCAVAGAEMALLTQVENEQPSCPRGSFKVTSLGASTYRVEGCGPPETFVCVPDHGWVCTKSTQ